MTKGDADIVGPLSELAELTVTVGCGPSIMRTCPPPPKLEVAVVVQLYTPAEAGAIALKVTTTLSFAPIEAPPFRAVRFMAVGDRL